MPQSDNLVEKLNSRLEWKFTYQSWSIKENETPCTQKYMLAHPKILRWALFCIAMFYIVVNGSELGSIVIIQVNMQALPTI